MRQTEMKQLPRLRPRDNFFYVQLGARSQLSHPLSVKTFKKASTPDKSGFAEPPNERRTAMAEINAILRLREGYPAPIEIQEEPVCEHFEVGHRSRRTDSVLRPQTSPGEVGQRAKLIHRHSLAQFFRKHPQDRHLRVSRGTILKISRCSGVHDDDPSDGNPLK